MSKNLKTFDNHLTFKKTKSNITLKINQHHLNKGGIVHGGVIASLCDEALAHAINPYLEKNQWAVTIQLNVEFMEPSYLGDTLIGSGKVSKIGKTLIFVDGNIKTLKGKSIAKAHGIWFLRKKNINL